MDSERLAPPGADGRPSGRMGSDSPCCLDFFKEVEILKKCADCKFLDRTRSIYWRGMFGRFYVCKKSEAEQQAANNRDMTQRPIFAPSYLDTDGNQRKKK